MNHDSGYVKIKVHDIIDRKHILHELITWGLWLKVRLPGRRRRGWSERMLSMGKKKLDWFYLMSSLIPIKVAMRCLRPAPFKLKTPPIACWTKWTSNQQVLRGMEPSMNRLQKKFLLDLGLSGFLFIVGVSSHNKKKNIPTEIVLVHLRLNFPVVSEMTSMSSILPQYVTTLGKKIDLAEQAKDLIELYMWKNDADI